MVPATDAPAIEATVPLRDELNEAISLLIADPTHADCVDVLGVLRRVHDTTYTAVIERMRAAGSTVADADVNAAAERFSAAVERSLRPSDWRRGRNAEIVKSNSDNIRFFLTVMRVQLRHNSWSKRDEIKWPQQDWRRRLGTTISNSFAPPRRAPNTTSSSTRYFSGMWWRRLPTRIATIRCWNASPPPKRLGTAFLA